MRILIVGTNRSEHVWTKETGDSLPPWKPQRAADYNRSPGNGAHLASLSVTFLKLELVTTFSLRKGGSSTTVVTDSH